MFATFSAACALCLYQLLLWLLLPVAWRRGAQQAPARNGERFGFFSHTLKQRLASDARQRIWIHAASVGESIVAMSVIRALNNQRQTPLLFVVTTVTATAAEQIEKNLPADDVIHLYAPYDLQPVVNRFLATVQPALCLLIETELWPQWAKSCAHKHIPQLLVNGRLSEKSARAYARFRWLAQPMLRQLHGLLMQNATDAQRFVDLGVDDQALQVTGSIKFDLELSAEVKARAAELKNCWHEYHTSVWLVASTHQQEEDKILAAWDVVKQQVENVLLVIVPRHPQRFDTVAALLEKHNIAFARQSHAPQHLASIDVLLGDTMGELLAFYGACDVATVGGTLVDIGGHNLIEPAAWGVPVTTGPYLRNFLEIANQLESAGGLVVADNEVALADTLVQLLGDSGQRKAIGEAAESVALKNRGALQKTVAVIESMLNQ